MTSDRPEEAKLSSKVKIRRKVKQENSEVPLAVESDEQSQSVDNNANGKKSKKRRRSRKEASKGLT